MAKIRGVRPDGYAVQRARRAKTWSVGHLSGVADVGIRTIETIESEQYEDENKDDKEKVRVDENTMIQIATDLGVPLLSLLKGDKRDWKLKLPRESMRTWSQEKSERFVRALDVILELDEEVTIIGMKEGCLELTLRLTPEQVAALVKAFGEGKLVSIGISEIGTTDDGGRNDEPQDD